MEVMLEKKMTLGELAAPFKSYPQVLENVRVTDKHAVKEDTDVQELVAQILEELGDDGRILIRESVTEPVVRVMAEAGDTETCQKFVDRVVNLIKSKGYNV